MPAMIGGFGKINYLIYNVKYSFLLVFCKKSNAQPKEELDFKQLNNVDTIVTYKLELCSNYSLFGPYLAGLIEADGSIAIHDEKSKAKIYRPMIIIVFSLSDKPLADKLSSITEVGKVYHKKDAGYVLWQIQKKKMF